MIATTVIIHVKPENVEDFKKISLYNHENSRKEPGNVRFDVLQSNDDPTYFTLYEVYESPEAAKARAVYGTKTRRNPAHPARF